MSADCGDISDKVFGPNEPFPRAEYVEVVPSYCSAIRQDGTADVARSVGESDLASGQPNRQPSLQTSRHRAGVKRLELMACQLAGPICCDSVRS
jgi:hypothetical protein